MAIDYPWLVNLQDIKKNTINEKIRHASKNFKRFPDAGASCFKALVDRSKLCAEVRRLLKNIKFNECLLTQNGLTSIDDKLFLIKRIGTKSKYGHAYLVSSEDRAISASIKIADDNRYAIREIGIMQKIIKNVSKSIHLPLIYKLMYCDISSKDNVWVHDVMPGSNSTAQITQQPTNYYIILNELAHGDLKRFVFEKKYDSKALYLNAIVQVLLSISALHGLGYNHNDSHYGNFLYHMIESKGCFCYVIDDDRVYLENVGFLWTIWDFGLSKPLNFFYMQDFKRVMNAFIPRNNKRYVSTTRYSGNYHGGWNEITKGDPDVSKIDDFVQNKARSSYDIFSFLKQNGFLSKSPIGEVLNEKPVIVNTISGARF